MSLNTCFHRVVGTWNSLSLSIREVGGVNSFKPLVKNEKKFFLWISVFLNVFLVIISNINSITYTVIKFVSFFSF